ncbi:MAG: hypothetical protein HGA75_10460 [Thiobacillus sp.]|nr:hypothetical protein [Thiobacillus sp.]
MFKWLEAVRAKSHFAQEQAQSPAPLDNQDLDGLGPEYVCSHQSIEVVDISPAEFMRYLGPIPL